MIDALLSPAEAARDLCISEKHLRALTVAGEIPYVNVGLGGKRETRRYEPGDIEAFRQARTISAAKLPSVRLPRLFIDASDFQARLGARRKRRP